MKVVRWSPMRELDAMDRRMRRMFEDFDFAPTSLPASDVYETDDEFVIEIEAPGFDEKELSVEVTDHTLLIKGERQVEKEEKEKAFYRRERLESSFERRFELPPEADTQELTAAFEKGVLEIHTKKAVEATPHKVAIEAK